MLKKWVYHPIPSTEEVASLASSLNISPTLASLMCQRCINTFDLAKKFFRPTIQDFHDPFLMKDMDKAIERIQKAISNTEKILIYGDYDVDGTTSVALVYGILKTKYANIEYYIPDRYTEGYGISYKSLDWAKENNINLIISLDCGIKSNAHVEKASEYSIDFIICDHHQPGKVLPAAIAVLDAKRDDCSYPYKELSGCGVGFKLLQALYQRNEWNEKELHSQLDLLAISVASDIVPITGENRVFTYYGLKVLNESCRPGFKALVQIAGYKRKLDITDIVFGIGPRINAAGRVAHAHAAVKMMLSDGLDDANTFANQLNDKNVIRKDFDSNITVEAITMIENSDKLLSSKSTVLFKEDWHKGVIGIVASRCIEKYYKPTIILTASNGMLTGSARSVEGFDVYEAIAQCSELLEQFGGHKYAAGLTLRKENIFAFQEKFESVVCENIKEDQLIPKLYIDMAINLNQINAKFYNIIKQMAPFGPGNMQPVFVSHAVYDDGNCRLLKEAHIKLCVKQDDSTAIEAIGFGMADKYEGISCGQKFNLCYTICENEFNGKTTLQLVIKDIEFIDTFTN